MKHILTFFLVACLSFTLAVSVLADGEDDGTPSDALAEASEPVSEDIVSSVLNTVPSYSVGLPAVIVELFGEYQPRTVTETVTHSDGSTYTVTSIVPGIAGLDVPWISAVVIFALSLYCIFRMIGGFFKWN